MDISMSTEFSGTGHTCPWTFKAWRLSNIVLFFYYCFCYIFCCRSLVLRGGSYNASALWLLNAGVLHTSSCRHGDKQHKTFIVSESKHRNCVLRAFFHVASSHIQDRSSYQNSRPLWLHLLHSGEIKLQQSFFANSANLPILPVRLFESALSSICHLCASAFACSPPLNLLTSQHRRLCGSHHSHVGRNDSALQHEAARAGSHFTSALTETTALRR